VLNLYSNTKGRSLPLDPGDIIHGPVADYLYEQQDQFNHHYRTQVCQKCGRTSERMHCVNLDCELMEDDDDFQMECVAPAFYMFAICEECHRALKEWLNIAIQDSMETSS
jgi:hypothetical protein